MVAEALPQFTDEGAPAQTAPPKGFKQTEIGLIPEDWEVVALGDVATIKAAGDLDKAGYSPWRDDEHSYPIFANAISASGLYGFSSKANYSAGSVTVTARGELGHAFERTEDFSAIGRLLVLEPQVGLNTFLLAAFINHLVEIANESTGVPQLTAPQMSRYVIPLPPLAEQKVIAGALKDADEAIRAVERLIAKQRAVKQAALHALLTPTIRLPGFDGEWETKTLGEVSEIDTENLSASTSKNYAFNYISLENVDRGALLGWEPTTYGRAPSRARRILQNRDVLFGTVRPNLQSHTIYGGTPSDAVCSTGFAVIRCDVGYVEPTFVFQAIFAHQIVRQIEMLIAGSNYPAISNRDVAKLEISLPSLAEQRAIAAVLSDMDAAIAALEARRDKLKAVKQGMMQSLLTGKVRLV